MLRRIADVPSGSVVYIYGCGEAGSFLRRTLLETRNDVTVAAFLDSFKNGSKDGLDILRPEQLAQRSNQSPYLILIASMYYKDMERELRIWGLGPYQTAAPRLLQPLSKRIKIWFRGLRPRHRLYLLTIALLYPLNLIRSLTLRKRVYDNSVLHISYMTHKAFFAVQFLREQGMKADYLAVGNATKVWDQCDYQALWSAHPIKRAWQEFTLLWNVVSRYQIIHSHFSIFLSATGWELKLLKKMGRKIVVHYRGCTARDREKNFLINPRPDFNICYQCDYNARNCSHANNVTRRELGQTYGDLFLVTTPDIKDFVPHAVHLPFFAPPDNVLPPIVKKTTLDKPFKIVHITVHPGIEATAQIKQVIDNLIAKGYPIQFVFNQLLPYQDVLQEIATAHLTIGKMKMGYYANAQIESMCLGVPVITYVRPQFMTQTLNDSGLIFSDLAGLEKTLQYYLDNPEALEAKRRLARQSILKIHDNTRTAKQLMTYYKQLTT